MRERAWVSWSSGKDCATALGEARACAKSEVVGLVTTASSRGRVVSHGVPLALVERQAAALGLPLHVVELPSPCPNQEYERRMQGAIDASLSHGVSTWVYGDLHLADVRAFREQSLVGTGLVADFPLWGRDTARLARTMIAGGLAAILTCVDPAQLDPSFVGREYDAALLADLPPGVDPCGENGEFHTFVHDGPGFTVPISVEVGEVVERDGFVYADLLG
ncbi:MAG: hypothetical protein L0H93_02290 [Nocardioides sp.]|nr:hypothetical protein [Nocardioides sp.]